MDFFTGMVCGAMLGFLGAVIIANQCDKDSIKQGVILLCNKLYKITEIQP